MKPHRTRQFALLVAGALSIVAFGCTKPKVWVPPRIDLHQYGTLGLVDFPAEPGPGSDATRQFVVALHSAQAGVPVLELGTLAGVLRTVGHETLDPEAIRAIGERYRVDIVVLGELEIQEPRPNFSIQSFTEANASAEIHGTLDARFLDAHSGATIWSDQARGYRTFARVNVVAGQIPNLGAVDPAGEQAKLVAWLVGRVTTDFRGTWGRP